jgi:hypothetical protein
MYKQIKTPEGTVNTLVIVRKDGAFIPFDPANTDYQQFKIQVADGVPLEDPDGNVMTQEQVDEFLRTIP